MKKHYFSYLAVLGIALGLVFLSSTFKPVSSNDHKQTITLNVNHAEVSLAEKAVSGLARELPIKLQADADEDIIDHPVKPLPVRIPAGNKQDPVIQKSVTRSGINAEISTANAVNFPGLGSGDYSFSPNSAPPDTTGAVGATQYVQWVNESFAIFDKSTHTLIAGPFAGNSLFKNLGATHQCAVNNDGDPIVQYDKAANRWVLTQFSVTNGSTKGYYQCVAVSQTSDATGAYNLYAYNYGTSQFNDYPKLTVWPDGYYITFNIFTGNTFSGSKACAYDRNAMLAGGAASQICFQLSSSFGGLLPADLDGTVAPPTGSPNFFVNFGTNALNLWKFHADFTTPANSTFTGPTSIPVAAFTPACGGGTCIPQPGTSSKLDSLADRMMFRLAYRHFTDGHEALVVNHTVKVSGNKSSEVDGVRWYELRNPSGTTMASGTPIVYQQGTYSPDSTSRWMGSIAMDKVGNIALGYSKSSGSVYPSIFYTGRVPTDPLGTLEAENSGFTGTGSESGNNLHRWGDYSHMSVDPVDDCTFFYTLEYEKVTGSFNWSTRIVSFKFPSCQ